ncbi:EpsG family protein [Aurantimonas aggregata]|uniref:EpsG family protein n=1 Tax=Aurantimonas aggregata TaxID=2047720 RepID=A0A6L9MJL4_9HYPH|nr:EpsG family protein [Aurantimonas aggregata]NDV87836.1 EpsG family protein [Aurantimonas aggregata]
MLRLLVCQWWRLWQCSRSRSASSAARGLRQLYRIGRCGKGWATRGAKTSAEVEGRVCFAKTAAKTVASKMVPYWILFAWPALAAIVQSRPNFARVPRLTAAAAVGALALAIFIGLRHNVGADWNRYLYHYSVAGYTDLGDLLTGRDPGYAFLNWISNQLGWGIHGVNLICGIIFAAGLVAFCRAQPFPWLAMVIAVPYLVVVVAMGYSRQGIALGLVMFALTYVPEGRGVRAIILIVAAALFHRSAAIVLPFIILATLRGRAGIVIALGGLFALLFFSSEDEIDRIQSLYLDRGLESDGALIRVIMNVIPASLFLILQRRLPFRPRELKLWWWISIGSFATLIAWWALPSSTLVDRIALYMLPIQIAVLSRMPLLVKQHTLGVVAIVLYSMAILFVWLNFSAYAEYWVPYTFYPLVEQV